MKELIAKTFRCREKIYGDAALEFAAALASGILKMTLDDTKALLEDTIKVRGLVASPLLGLLLLANKLYPVIERDCEDAVA